MKTIITSKGTLEYPETVGRNNGVVEAKLWEASGKVRVYFTVHFGHGYKTDCGFYDCVTGLSYMKSNPVATARNIEAELEFKTL